MKGDARWCKNGLTCRRIALLRRGAGGVSGAQRMATVDTSDAALMSEDERSRSGSAARSRG